MSERRAAPLIVAKQVIPPVRPGAVPRGRLHAPLLGNVGSRLSVVVAPAGWGKTTLLSHWAHDPAETRGIVWVSLDEADDDPVRFWTYVLTALQRDVAGLGPAALAALSTPVSNRSTSRCRRCSTSSTAVDDRHVLVLDDYHLLGAADVHESVEFLLTYLPAALRVVIAGRSDPPLPLARLRARGELTELRAAELGFTVDEAAALLTAVGDMPVDVRRGGRAPRAHRGLGRRPAARGPDDPPRGATGRGGRPARRRRPAHPRLPVPGGRRPARSGPARPARPGRPSSNGCPGRCATLRCSARGSADVLDALDRADLFVTALDPRREWYRCHRLLRDVLLRRLADDPDGRTRVLARAADWFLARGYVAEAVAHRIAAGDEDGAAELLRSQVPAFLERGELAVAPAAGSAAAGGRRAAGRAAVRVPGVGGRPERAVPMDGAVAGRRRAGR